MNKLITLIAFIIPATLFAQQDSTKVYQFCEVTIHSTTSNSRINIDINMGEQRLRLNKGRYRLRDNNNKLINFNSAIDALNYLSKDGWIFVQALPLSHNSSSTRYSYILKKEFFLHELEREESESEE